ncbi:hypothetical protein AB4Z45_27800 [Paenibacillus sp. MCAF9]|uniref:hypothetical protein n=1 Tax=Paenibacillus sp. MCAF9 TaxID=3233046 RepID=UPI003F9DFCC0
MLLYRFTVNDEVGAQFEIRHGKKPGKGWGEPSPDESLWDVFTRLSAQNGIPMESWGSSKGVLNTETDDDD